MTPVTWLPLAGGVSGVSRTRWFTDVTVPGFPGETPTPAPKPAGAFGAPVSVLSLPSLVNPARRRRFTHRGHGGRFTVRCLP